MRELLERGDLQFFWTPSVQPADADELVLAVQSLFAILSPEGGAHRRLRIGKKRMPASPRDRFWARIERVGSLQRVLGDKLEPERYLTKTRGERFQPGARPIAQGTYELVRHDDHVHLTYDVEPLLFEDAPDELAIASSADHLVLWKAPEHARATWSHQGEPSSLDCEGTELVLVGECRHAHQDSEALSE
jgi:hypothetical protein